MKVKPLTLSQANDFIEQFHRHHKRVVGHRFSIGVFSEDGTCNGVCVVGRPVARKIDQYMVAEVTRLATDGSKNACSMLYSAAARACQAMGFESIQTYTLESEGGASLRASNWICDGQAGGGDWNCEARGGRRTDQHVEKKVRWRRTL